MVVFMKSEIWHCVTNRLGNVDLVRSLVVAGGVETLEVIIVDIDFVHGCFFLGEMN